MRLVAVLIAIAALLASCQMPLRTAQAQTPDEWWSLVRAIDARQDKLDADEKRFIRNVTNRLAVSPDAVPTPEHRHWLLNIKRKLRL